MRVGTVAERKDGEFRVGLTPEGVSQLRRSGHEVIVETRAGAGSGFDDRAYAASGAAVAGTAGEVWESCELVVKVKEPLESEYELLRRETTLFTFLHLASSQRLTEALVRSGCTAIAYELVRARDGSLPLLAPMSQIAGRMAAEVGASLLRHPGPGRGKLLGGIGGVPPGKAVIVGSGSVGTAAARVAMGLDARVVMLSDDLPRLRALQERYEGRIATRRASPQAIAEEVVGADLVVLAVLVPGAAAPHVLTREMVASMGAGSVLVDVSIDQGGAAETSRPTAHSEPTFVEEGVIHYCVPNMPGAVPETSTLALTAATLPYVEAIADEGVEGALRADPGLAAALSTHRGQLVRDDLAAQFEMEAAPNPFV